MNMGSKRLSDFTNVRQIGTNQNKTNIKISSWKTYPNNKEKKKQIPSLIEAGNTVTITWNTMYCIKTESWWWNDKWLSIMEG